LLIISVFDFKGVSLKYTQNCFMMFFKAKNTFLFIFFLVLYISSQAQNYADKNYYLVDSLEYDILIESEKKRLDSSLKIYHKTTSDIQKLEAINFIVENSWDDNLWPKYNQWIYNLTKEKLNGILLNESFKNLSEKEKILLKYYSNSINNFGVVNATKGDLTLSLEFFYQSLIVREKINDTIGISESYINIGSIYHTQGNLSKDFEFNKKALIIAEKLDLKEALVTIYNNLGVSYSKKMNNVKALEFHEKSLAINKELKSAIGIASSLSQIGRIYKDNGNLTEGLSYLLESLKVIEEYGYQAGIISALTDIASVYFEQGNISQAKITAEKAMKIALKHGDPVGIMQTSLVLSSIYKKNDNWEKAFVMKEVYFKMRDSIQNNEIEKSLIEQQSKYNLEKKEQEIELLSTKNVIQELKLTKNKNSIILISIALFLAIVTAFVSFRGYKKKLYINKLLERQKIEISRQNEAKKTMLQEIHHRVKNNLQVVNSLLRMQSSKMEDENIVGMFRETQSRIRSMARLHEKMYQSGDLEKLNAKEHITMLVEEIVKNYSVDKTISLNLDIDTIFIDSQTMMPLSLIINEIISNSLKYAFEGREKGGISVKLNKLEGRNELIISDDGVGYVSGSVTEGLGTRLIDSFTRQLNGSIEKVIKNGTSFKLIFKHQLV